MEPGPAPPGRDGGEGPSSSSAAAATSSGDPPPPPPSSQPQPQQPPPPPPPQQPQLSRYESQKRRDWNTFLQYLKNHKPPLTLARCSGAHVIEFLKYLDQFGKTKVHAAGCTYFGHPSPPAPCACPLKQAWGSLDALIGRLRAAYEENGGRPESNPFGAKAVRIYLREVRESQAKARGIPYEKKKRKRITTAAVSASGAASASESTEVTVAVAGEGSSAGGGESSASTTVGATVGSTSANVGSSSSAAAAAATSGGGSAVSAVAGEQSGGAPPAGGSSSGS